MKPWSRPLLGRFDEHEIDSQALTGNPLGDPHRRPLWVYLPPGYDEEPERRYPSVYVIQGLTGQLDMWRNRKAFRPNYPELVDELFGAAGVPPAVVVWVDAWTSLGGSQFIDSPGTGRYHTYLCEEIVPFVDASYRTRTDAAQRAITGHSSGGAGSMVSAMLRPDLFGALATHAGDALFEHCFLPDLRETIRTLRDSYEGSFAKFWEDFRSRPAFSRGTDGTLLNIYCMAACYSADADGTVRLPFDAAGRLDEEVWGRWLTWDPVRMVSRHADALRSMRAIWIDAGRSDEYYLDLGAEAFRAALAEIGVAEPVVRFELFDGRHGSIEHRYPLALRFLLERMSEPAPQRE
jgi:S-formylglutathione hydrolase FrmB